MKNVNNTPFPAQSLFTFIEIYARPAKRGGSHPHPPFSGSYIKFSTNSKVRVRVRVGRRISEHVLLLVSIPHIVQFSLKEGRTDLQGNEIQNDMNT